MDTDELLNYITERHTTLTIWSLHHGNQDNHSDAELGHLVVRSQMWPLGPVIQTLPAPKEPTPANPAAT